MVPSRRFPDLLRRQGRATPGGIRAWTNLPNLREGSTLAPAQDDPRVPSPRILEPAGGVCRSPASGRPLHLPGMLPRRTSYCLAKVWGLQRVWVRTIAFGIVNSLRMQAVREPWWLCLPPAAADRRREWPFIPNCYQRRDGAPPGRGRGTATKAACRPLNGRGPGASGPSTGDAARPCRPTTPSARKARRIPTQRPPEAVSAAPTGHGLMRGRPGGALFFAAAQVLLPYVGWRLAWATRVPGCAGGSAL